MMHVRTLKTICDVDRDTWNAIVGRNRLICRHEYLHAIEVSRINDCRYFYPVVYDGDKILAHTCVYFISTELDLFAKGLAKRLVDCVRRVWSGFMILRSVECGTPVALGSTISFRDGTDTVAALGRIVEETERVAKGLNVKVLLFRDFCDDELDFFDQLKDFGYTRIRNLPSARMEIRWDSFRNYADSMRSQYRYRMQRRIRAFEKADSSFELINDFSPFAEDLAGLWRNCYNHATEYRREMLTKDFFENIDKKLGRRSSILLARIRGRPVGFSLMLHDHDTLVWVFCGLDYEYSGLYSVYFNMLYKIVEYGIREGFKDIDLGITTLIPKMDVGGITVPLHMYMKHTNPLLNRIVPRLFDMMTPKETLNCRRVFRAGM